MSLEQPEPVVEPNPVPPAKSSGTATGILAHSRRWASSSWAAFWTTIRTFGVIAWGTAIFAFAWFTGLVDSVRTDTPGIIRIESPQIYTRERLVNDRFREQAWLEKQLAELETRANAISSSRTDNFSLSVKQAAKAAEGQTASEVTGAGSSNGGVAAADKTRQEEQALLVSADDSFNLQRNMRATIRRALIENELDDRHDLGSNSLYQFNFGAAIITGPRTRKIAAIEMEIEPLEKLIPLDEVIGDPDSACLGLIKYECGYLISRGILTKPSARDSEFGRQFDRWNELFQKWINSENSSYGREAVDIRELLQSEEGSNRIRLLMKPFFENLNLQARTFADNLEDVTILGALDTPADDSEDKIKNRCEIDIKGHFNRSIHRIFSDFAQECFAATNYFLMKMGNNQTKLDIFSRNINLYDTESLKTIYKDIVDQNKTKWEQYFLYIFKKFNVQCTWGNNFIIARNEGSGVYFELDKKIEFTLIECIYRAVIRDFGSHPFSQIQRDDADKSVSLSAARTGNEVSSYLARKGLSSVLVTGEQQGIRLQERFDYVGTVSSVRDPAKISGLVQYPFTTEKMNETCKRNGVSVAPNFTMGVSSAALLGTSSNARTSAVNPDIGWNLLSHLICATKPSGNKTPDADTALDGHYNIPTGLFHFINLLSSSQKTFSYSVQPSGAFSLQSRESTKSWQGSGLFGLGEAKPESEIAVRRDSAESWIEKQYRIIGFGTQYGGAQSGIGPTEGQAQFGWYVFPGNTQGGFFAPPVMDSANIKLSALISLPAWWEKVNIRVKTSWLKNSTLEKLTDEDTTQSQNLVLDLPTRLEFIRNHFPNAAAIRPSLDQLQQPQVTLSACQNADIVLKGERLWRSTVVTLGSQRSSLIQVMPDMRGIIARFDKVVPSKQEGPDRSYLTPVTVWTSEGQKTVIDAVKIDIPEIVSKRMNEGLEPCPSPTAVAGK